MNEQIINESTAGGQGVDETIFNDDFLTSLLLQMNEDDRRIFEEILLKHLLEADRKEYIRIQKGELQLFLAAIADINTKEVQDKISQSSMLTEIVNEVRELTLSKEMQFMLLSEKYAIADMNAVKSYERRQGRNEGLIEGRNEGRNNLITAIKRIRAGESVEDLIASGIDEETAKAAASIS